MGSNERFIGLSNQGATCYMNSLLQTLFMTPEFLSRLYQWKWDPSKHNSKKDCIPYQLQLMFAKLHKREYSVVDTTGLTTSFQWDIRESLQQHDVQEFCRVLFDAIEESVKGTEQEKMITELYEGQYVDYVKCLKCGTESTREDKFLDLSLAVRSHNQQYNDSLEKALNNFVKPDHLCGDNKYFCETCGEKTDAYKGMKFSRLPYILALQLKRFDLDYNTLQRKKINDRVTFPTILDMAKAVEQEDEDNDDQIEHISSMSNIECEHESLSEGHSESSRENNEVNMSSVDKDSSSEGVLNNGSFYELFSIMIHSGSALGGHYYAYIRCFENNKWYHFNDSQVKEIETSEIEKAFGGIVGAGIFGSNAYLLMYRQISDKNLKQVSEMEIPEYLIQDIELEKLIILREQKEKEERLLTIEVKVFYKYNNYLIKINKHASLNLLKKKCIKELDIGLEDEDVRIRIYNSDLDQYLETFTGKESQTIESLGINSGICLCIETKTADEEFLEFEKDYLNIKICVWKDYYKNYPGGINEILANPCRLQVPKSFKLKDLLNFLAKYFHYAFDNIRLWKKKPYYGKSKLIELVEPKHLNTRIASLKVFDGFLILMEEKTWKNSWKDVIDKDNENYTLRFNNPKVENIEYNMTISVNKNETLFYLKELIGKKISMQVEDFNIKKGSRNGQDLTEDESLLSSLQFYQNCVVHISEGVGKKESEISFSLFFACLSNKDEDYLWYLFYELFPLTVHKSINISSLKQSICDMCQNYYPSLGINPSNIRLREKFDNKLADVISEKRPIDIFHGCKNLEIAVEIIDEYQENEVVCVFRKWTPSTWDFSPPVQISFNRYSSLSEIAEILGDYFRILPHQIEITRITYLNNFIRGDLICMDWVHLYKGFQNNNNDYMGRFKEKYILEDKPFFVLHDGICFV